MSKPIYLIQETEFGLKAVDFIMDFWYSFLNVILHKKHFFVQFLLVKLNSFCKFAVSKKEHK